eukprot:1211181-Ditylum_brightwellii.AAC.1
MKHFYGTYMEICNQHNHNYYKEFKAWADYCFVIQHHNETRGLGECLNSVMKAYEPIAKKHKDDEFTQKQKEWQLMRSGRYI